jgi:hypothetical protein
LGFGFGLGAEAGDSLADGVEAGTLDGAAAAGEELETGGAGEGDVALGDGELLATAAAFCWGFAGAASLAALHPLITTATPTINTGSKRTRTAHLTHSSDICLRI